MSNGLIMHVSQRFYDVLQILNCLLDIEASNLIQIIEKSPSVHILHYQVDIFIFLEHPVEFDDVRVVEG
jgi:hypothetical protein